MSAVKVIQQSSNEEKKTKGRGSLQLDTTDTQNDESDLEVMKIIFEEDPDIFLLNNLLMSVQFFENYERDIEILRENWFKEVSLESHHKKCFYADSLFRLTEENVKFAFRHGPQKNSQVSLHPFRIYISSDNIEAAYDPSVLGRNKLNLWPQYQFTVRTNEAMEKLGYISLIEFKTIEAPVKSPKTKTPKNNFAFHEADTITERNSNSVQRKPVIEEKYNRRLTKVGYQSWKANSKIIEKLSTKYLTFSKENTNGFYHVINSETKLTPINIHDFRMNSLPLTSHEIPPECFQKEEVMKQFNSRRIMLSECFRSQYVLNSAAFKGYFCDLLIDKLCKSLSLDSNAINDSSILEEFVNVRQKGAQYCLTPVITIRDWNNFPITNKNFQEVKTKQLGWPSDQMQKIMNILPCNAVPTGFFNVKEENSSYEKTWKLVFPKTEEFLMLHMMHAHVRCYYFVLLLYKSFIETEINSASLGPKHLMHLLFWRVHKNFLGWPEDRPGETLLNYLKILYKKLQNKFLSDFFITSRNLLAHSLPKDLHKAQVLIKKIIENPVPYVMRAVRNLNQHPDFYPGFDVLKLNKILNAESVIEKLKKAKKQKKHKTVNFQNGDGEQQLKKIAMKQINLEKKAEEEEQNRKGSIESINLDKNLDLYTKDFDKCNQILKTFISHFIDIANRSLEYNFLSQAFLYLNQIQKLFELSVEKEMEQSYLKATKERINGLKEACYRKLKQDLKKSTQMEKNLRKNVTKDEVSEKPKVPLDKDQIHQKEDEKVNINEEIPDENEFFSVKL